jgi:aminoglycoside 3-N-acetyltransferase I
MPGRPLTDDEAAAYLREPTVLNWVAEEGGVVVGHLLSYVELRRAGEPRQLLLYEIGVREASRRRGVGTALMEAMRRWMRDERVDEAWVLADNPEAEAFYATCGFPATTSRRYR